MSEFKLYKDLGIPRNASPDDIKKAYKKMAMQHHPDKGGDEEAFKRVQLAYEVLKDDDKRRQYDQMGDAAFEEAQRGGGGGPGGGMHVNINDIFAQMFGGGMRMGGGGGFSFNQQRHQNQRGQNHVQPLRITLQEAFHGVNKTLRVKLNRPCSECRQKCEACNGSGNITQRIQQGPFIQIMSQMCGTCGASGVIQLRGRFSCQQCNGEAECTEVKELSIKLPPGISTGNTLKFDGLGELGPAGPGDLIFEVHIAEHNIFKRQGDSLLHVCTISLAQSIVGTEIVIPCFDGPLTIHTKDIGIISPGRQHVIHGRGMANANTPGNKGNLIIEFKVEYPSKVLADSDRILLESAFKEVGWL
jgi:DnaJ-class molecular chaperone